MRTRLVFSWLLAPVFATALADAQALAQRGGDDLPPAFVRRSKVKSTAKFLTAKSIEALKEPSTPDLLARVSGGEVQEASGVAAIVRKRGNRPNMIGEGPAQPCVVAVAINENVLPVGYDLKVIRLGEIAALEFYDSPSSIPLELSGKSTGESACGLFVIWMRERRSPR
jgi:hypothetical protein